MAEFKKNDALFVVDLQNGFMSTPTKRLPRRIATFLTSRPFLHNAFFRFVNKKGTGFSLLLDWQRMKKESETKLVDEVEPFAQTVFLHSTYSLFNPAVRDWLSTRKIRRIFFCGTYTDVCVLMGCLEAFDLGFEPIVLSDLVGTQHGHRRNDEALQTLERAIGKKRVIASARAKP